MKRRLAHLLALILFLALALERPAPLGASETILLEFDFVNSFNGYTKTVSVNSNGVLSLAWVFKRTNGREPIGAVKLSDEQLARIQVLLNGIHPDSLMPVYDSGSLATDQPTYIFRFPHEGKWVETRIDSGLNTPEAPGQLLDLRDFLMEFVNRE